MVGAVVVGKLDGDTVVGEEEGMREGLAVGAIVVGTIEG